MYLANELKSVWAVAFVKRRLDLLQVSFTFGNIFAKMNLVMNLGIYIFFSALLGSLIGWSTNVVAIKLIFRPYKRFNLLGFIPVQGLIPKRRAEIAIAIGDVVEKELLSSADLIERLTSSGDIEEKLVRTISENIKNRLLKYFPPFIPATLKENLLHIIDSVIAGEAERFFRDTLPALTNEIKDTIPVAAMVEEKINNLDLRELEELILRIAKKELKHIEYLGGVIGLIIGLFQGILFVLLT